MKTLLILRHAKSSWKHPGMADHERSLNKRGKRDAPRMGRLIREEGLEPDLILTSPARRAYETARIVAEESRAQAELRTIENFYGGGPGAYLEALASLDDDLQSVLVVGHNPDLEELLETLTGDSESLPTAALAVIKLPVMAWNELSGEPEGKLVHVWVPRSLDE